MRVLVSSAWSMFKPRCAVRSVEYRAQWRESVAAYLRGDIGDGCFDAGCPRSVA